MSDSADDTPDSNATNSPESKSIRPRLDTPMTASEDPTKSDDDTKAPTSKKTGKRKSRWWWRWTKRFAVAGVAARIVLWLFLEQIANFGAGFAGLSIEWRSASLSLAGVAGQQHAVLVGA